MGEEYIYVAVDETGNLGKSLKGERYYTVVACVVNDRRRFEDATRRLGFNEEVKFQTHDVVREKVLRYAAPAVSKVMFTCYHKGKGPVERHEQPILHLNMVRTMADDIVSMYGSRNDLVVEVDHKDGVPDRLVRKVFEDNENRMNDVECEVLDSRFSYGLQTNDFIVGAIGRMVNLNDKTYVRMLYSEPEQKYVHSSNRRQGEPASATPVEYRPHGQSIMDSPPGIAAEFHRKDGGPAVRLDRRMSEGYLRNGRKNLIGSRNRRRQGEPASTQLVEYRPHGQSTMDSPPGIAIQLRTPRAGYHMVRLDGSPESSYLKGRRGSGRLFGSMKRHKR